ncbi:MAG TPA: phosphoenolpyruvate--protein phosphotransferase [Gemmatimonadota bacterium]|nr:phosphoenolpyruvate--protein phosphotransferase [Gemmatimonadota bacterium]
MAEPLPQEIFHHGQGVSPGVAYGPAYLITPDALRVPQRTISAEDIDAELSRFEDALAATRADIERVKSALERADKGDEAAIFDSHLLILEDETLLDSVRERIREGRMNVEFAFSSLVLETVDRIEKSENTYLRERVRDIRDVEHRVVRFLLGQREPAVGDLLQNAILVAHDLPATLTAELDRDRILGFATELGSANSHTAILARALEIPAVVDLGPVMQRLSHGESVVLDGREGLLIQSPSPDTLAEYERIKAKIERKRAEWVSLAGVPGRTADGEPLTLLANIEFTREVDAALAFGCDGIGLYRTEYLFLQSGGEVPEEDQHRVYRGIVRRMEGRPVTIRTLDLGGDKLLAGMEQEDNPFLGWRAVRYCLDRPEVFLAQMRAILRAGAEGPVAIMIPMITTLEEVNAVLELVGSARESLRSDGLPHADTCPVGMLVETPAAALMAENLAERFDFLSLGTNDLIQYTLAVDRGNRRIAHLYQPFHPAVLRLIREVVDAAAAAGKPVTVCGEMGSNSRAAALLLGLGVRSFSMVPARIPRIKQVLGRVTVEEASETAREALRQSDSDSVKAVVDRRFGERFHHAPSS